MTKRGREKDPLDVKGTRALQEAGEAESRRVFILAFALICGLVLLSVLHCLVAVFGTAEQVAQSAAFFSGDTATMAGFLAMAIGFYFAHKR